MAYSSSLSYLLQISIVAVVILLYLTKPIMTFPVILILNILPNQIFYATNSVYANHYQLNSTMVILMLLVMAFYRLFVVQKGKTTGGLNSTTFLPMVIIMATSIVWSSAPNYYSSDFYMMLLIYLAVPLFMRDEYDVNIVWLSFGVSGGLFALALMRVLRRFGNIYQIAAIADRNYLAMFGILTLMFLVNFVSSNYARQCRIVSLVAMVFSGMIVWLTFSFASRTAFVLLVVFVALHMMTIFWKNKKAAFLIAVVGGVVVWFVYNSDVANFLFERFQMSSVVTGNGRFSIAAEFLNGFFESNILWKIMGYGYNGFMAMEHFAHNSYLSMLLDFGLICFIPFMIILIRIVYNLWRSQYRHFTAAFLVFMVYMATLDAHTNSTGVCFLAAFAGISDVAIKGKYRRINEKERIMSTI